MVEKYSLLTIKFPLHSNPPLCTSHEKINKMNNIKRFSAVVHLQLWMKKSWMYFHTFFFPFFYIVNQKIKMKNKKKEEGESRRRKMREEQQRTSPAPWQQAHFLSIPNPSPIETDQTYLIGPNRIIYIHVIILESSKSGYLRRVDG